METADRLYVIANPLSLQIDEETEEVKEVTPSNVASDWALAEVTAALEANLAPETSDLTAFTDATEVSSWVEDAVARLAANGIMNGTTTTLSSQDTTSVEMSILLLYRISLLI